MLVFGYDPIAGYTSMIRSSLGTTRTIGETVSQATPLILTALGFSVANSAGFFNIGLSGQALCGWVASVWVALAFNSLPAIVLIPLAIFVGALAGAFAAAIPGVLRAYFGTSEVIVTIMLNYIFLYLSTYIVHNSMAKSMLSSKDSTIQVGSHASLRISALSDWTMNSSINGGIIIACIALFLMWFVMKKTTLGFEIRSVGLNPFASDYAGISSKRTIIVSMILSGALAGLAGVVQGLGTYQNFFVQGGSLSIGFDGMAVSLLGAGSAVGIFFSAILFSILKVGGLGMPLDAGVPFELVNIVIASIIFFVGVNYLIRLLLTRKKRREIVAQVDSQSREDGQNKQEGGIL
ncbi:branched-chain amino acid ABC transporter permease [Vagococcus entomophilus]|uniref:Branched-chain amino acid ABC transporter permease n=2 Tax=Vagococcus entomophilus TaxID=1160095 RepID=A0A430AHI1_9ENTE|nr:branched-chain amino acid ABC transporter permease [Vagococcus entomophilus]